MSSTNTDIHSDATSIPSESIKSDIVPSPTSSPPIPLQSTVVVRPVKGCVGVFEVIKHPIGLNEVELEDNYVEYSTLNTDKQFIRYLHIPELWTVEGRLEGAEDETLII